MPLASEMLFLPKASRSTASSLSSISSRELTALINMGRLTPEMTHNPAAFNFDILEGEADIDNLTLGNIGLADLEYDIDIGATADIVGDWDFGALSITSYDCGNIYSVATSTTLSEIKMYLSFTGSRQIYWLVYESTTISGTYNKIHETNLTMPGAGETWYSSGPISVPLVAGNFYMIIIKTQYMIHPVH